MRRVLCSIAACAWAATAIAELPLPPELHARGAIASDPQVQRALAAHAAARETARGVLAGPHEWTLNAAWQQRDIARAGSVGEWEAALQRGWRLPGKAEADRRIAEAGRAAAENAYEDAWHQAAVSLLDAWFAWLRADAERLLAADTFANASRDAAAIERRHAAADASGMDLDLGRAATAAARAQHLRAQRELEIARQTLALRYREIDWPSAAPVIDEPMPLEGTAEEWRQQVLVRSHEIGWRAAEQRRAEAQADRAALDRIPDPTLGVRVLNERGGDEKAVGIVFSQAFGGTARRSEAAAQRALARAAAAETRTVTQDITIHAASIVERAVADAATWQVQREALTAQDAHYRRAVRAYELGELGLADLLAFARLRLEAARAESQARLDAHYSRARLEVDSHTRWAAEELVTE